MPTIFDRSSFPENCLTHHGTAEFWEELGRTIASFSFLEYSVANADFALSSTHQFKTKEEFEAAYKSWEKILQASLTGGLKQRIALLKAHFNGDDRIPKSVAKGIVCRLKEIVDWRNVLCHGAWLQFNEDGSISRRFFKRDSKGFKTWNNKLTTEKVKSIRDAVVDVTVDVLDVVSDVGASFPGSRLPRHSP